MKTNKLIKNTFLIALLAVGLSACKSTTREGNAVVDTTAPTSDTVEKAPEPEKPAEFLATNFAPLDNWMNERYKIEYRAQTPDVIFEEVPLEEIHFNTKNLPENAEKFNFESESVSRRELLKAIAEHWNLKMEYELKADGTPIAVNVTG